jgi:hypothetical protein
MYHTVINDAGSYEVYDDSGLLIASFNDESDYEAFVTANEADFKPSVLVSDTSKVSFASNYYAWEDYHVGKPVVWDEAAGEIKPAYYDILANPVQHQISFDFGVLDLDYGGDSWWISEVQDPLQTTPSSVEVFVPEVGTVSLTAVDYPPTGNTEDVVLEVMAHLDAVAGDYLTLIKDGLLLTIIHSVPQGGPGLAGYVKHALPVPDGTIVEAQFAVDVYGITEAIKQPPILGVLHGFDNTTGTIWLDHPWAVQAQFMYPYPISGNYRHGVLYMDGRELCFTSSDGSVVDAVHAVGYLNYGQPCLVRLIQNV